MGVSPAKGSGNRSRHGCLYRSFNYQCGRDLSVPILAALRPLPHSRNVVEAVASAAAFHIETFGKEAFDEQDDVMEAFGVRHVSVSLSIEPGTGKKAMR
jgi:hypothetical protein